MKKLSDFLNKTILISRTDSIGDVVLTLPISSWLKQHFPTCRVLFLGKTYVQPVVACLPQIDEFISWDELTQLSEAERITLLQQHAIDIVIHIFPHKMIARQTKQAKIPFRIGTFNRLYHLFTCTHLPRFSRAKSDKHESQLNFELLKPLGLTEIPSLSEITELISTFRPVNVPLPQKIERLLALPSESRTVILHPKSQGSALEWPISHYIALAEHLLNEGHIVLFTGTEQEGALFRELIPKHPNCIDTTGMLTLSQLIVLIKRCYALVACSTGPLHLAGILSIKTVGLFSPRHPIHPGRWQPLGKKSHPIVYDENCPQCKAGNICYCIQNITMDTVYNTLQLPKCRLS